MQVAASGRMRCSHLRTHKLLTPLLIGWGFPIAYLRADQLGNSRRTRMLRALHSPFAVADGHLEVYAEGESAGVPDHYTWSPSRSGCINHRYIPMFSHSRIVIAYPAC